MKLQLEEYTRKPFSIKAVQVTDENMEAVAEWCKGKIETTDSKIAEGLGKEPEVYIKARVQQPMNDRQTKAFPGDWVLYMNNGYKIYSDKSFRRSFDKIEKTKKPSPPNVGGPVPMQPKNRSAVTGEFVTDEVAAANPDTTVTEQ